MFADPVLVFDTTHHAMWAEQLLLERGLAADIVPAPAAARAKCSLALTYLRSEETAVLQVLRDAAVPFRVHGEAPATP